MNSSVLSVDPSLIQTTSKLRKSWAKTLCSVLGRNAAELYAGMRTVTFGTFTLTAVWKAGGRVARLISGCTPDFEIFGSSLNPREDPGFDDSDDLLDLAVEIKFLYHEGPSGLSNST